MTPLSPGLTYKTDAPKDVQERMHTLMIRRINRTAENTTLPGFRECLQRIIKENEAKLESRVHGTAPMPQVPDEEERHLGAHSIRRATPHC